MRSMVLSQPIETARLRLREFVESDWEAILGASDSRAMKFFDEAPFTEDDAKAWVDSVIASQAQDPRMRYAFAVELKAGNTVIGYCDIGIRPPVECRMAYSGFRYIPEYWGNGYGTEAQRAIFDFGFRILGLERISCKCEPENTGSWRMMEKCGMRREGHGILDNWSTKRKKRINTYYYAILKEEWEKGNPTQQAAARRTGQPHT